MALRFHWMLPKSGEMVLKTAQQAAINRIRSTCDISDASLTDMPGWLSFARQAELAGIESLLISFSYYEPDPLIISCALGRSTTQLKFLAAYRSGLIQPTSFVQQTNTLSALIGGRVALNIVAGSSPKEQRGYGDFLDHDQRYARAEEFLEICRTFWQDQGPVNFKGRYYCVEAGNIHTPFSAPARRAPEIYVSGHSQQAQQLAFSQGDCWVRTADKPENLSAAVANARKQDIEVCLRCGIICRPSWEEAYRAAQALLPDHIGCSQHETIASRSNSQMFQQSMQVQQDDPHWLNQWLWDGLVPHNGPVWITLVGTPDTLAKAFLEYRQIGVTQFILSGWPESDELLIFGRDVLPRIRDMELTLEKETQVELAQR
ncbi:LLM class flavin-dependent oxidoreductase [Leptolyngbya cf. ectocarpi LEGE 11479]|uniref:LLM class flavin-dependent oxidoreductase n=1 Tax=Leptolyngbya cf. ectocarpi LEGE 11479 TaxID=1828722 RepID=A0A928ZX33_LEPEC|nr:LLM class flavin-dependent oxidoreductase [Leptolyngbya ectocarpi]MBE9069029.1 LLM class flavin-dependent oxidoreductase [Leptolyngbya cf. ectocarpi LEGE 11479]